MGDTIKFTIYGNPKAQRRHRMARRANYIAQIDDSKEDKANLLAQVMQHRPEFPWTGPVLVDMAFVVARPKSHFRTGKYAGMLRADAPGFCGKKPDIDNYIKFVLDALNGVFFLDDGQVARIRAEKCFDTLPERPRTELKLYKIEAMGEVER